jgi:IS5 family transposase
MKREPLAAPDDENAPYETCRKPTKHDSFLATKVKIVPRVAHCAVIAPNYPKAGNDRPPAGLQRMLRLYFMQQ